jgi:GH24 family phage-related lysozyme (muramidase)
MHLPLWIAGGAYGVLMPTKRVLSVALTLLLAVSFAAPSGARALAEYGFTYTQSGGEATVTGCESTCPTTLNIPAVLGGYFVTAIDTAAFNNEGLVALTIPSTVASIGSAAFDENALTSVTIPYSVTIIGNAAFQANNLTNVTIGNSVTSFGIFSFAFNNLTSVTFPNSVTSIGDSAFQWNDLTTVTIGNSVTSIGSYAFNSNELTAVTIPNSVMTIGDGAFQGNNLTTLTIPNSVTTIGSDAFEGNNLTTLTIPNSVTTIGDFAFQGNLLTTVTIGNSVTSIGTEAFSYNALTSATFLGDAPEYGALVFRNNESSFAVYRGLGAMGWGIIWSGSSVNIIDQRASATVKPTASGTATVGRTLTARGTWTGYPTPTLRYQWYVCTRAVTVARTTVPSTCKRITGATRSTYRLTAAQRGKYVAVLVTGTSLRTTATTWLSKTTSKVR